MNTDTEPKRSAFSHTVTAENGMVTVCRNGVPIYSFKADLVEEMAIEPRKLAGHGTPCAVLILRGAGPGGILFETHELAELAMRTIEGARRKVMRVFNFWQCDKHIRKNVNYSPPCIHEVEWHDEELIAMGAKVGESVVLENGDFA